MRWLTVLVVVAIPAIVAAKPKVAVAPIDGDEDDKIALVVADAADDHAKVVKPAKVAKAMESLSITTLNGKALKKLRINLEVDLVIHGSVEKDGKKSKLSLSIQGKGKNKTTVEVTFKSTKTLKKDLSKQLAKKFDNLLGGDEDPDDEEAPPKKFDDPPKKHDDDPPKHSDDDRPKKHDDDSPKHSDDDRRKHDDDRPKKRVADEGVRKRGDDDDEGEGRHRRRRHKTVRNPITQAALWLDAGAEVMRRTLTYDSGGGMTAPPSVGTASGAGALDVDFYPGAFDSLDSGTSALGIYGDMGYTVGLSIAVPMTTLRAPIKDAHYLIGGRYRFTFGSSSLAVGAGFWKRYYVADRSGLMMPGQLDMPDVNYVGVAPGVLARFAATPTVGGFVQLDIPLVLANGDIGSAKSYGRGTIIAFDLHAGAQIQLGDHYALAIAATFDQVGMSFEAAANSLAATRGVHGATDRTYGITAAIGVLY